MSILPDPETFKRLADGTAVGLGPAIARAVLAAMAMPYAAATAARNRLYDGGIFRQHHARIPVISVGNLTAGGTGKTPLVAWIARRLRSLGRCPAIVSRGYAARPGEPSDEAAELALLLPGIVHIADRNRVAGAETAAIRGADAVVLDDGFQHRRLHRDLDLVAIDASNPFGCGHILPRGFLRESVRGLCRADAIILTRASQIDQAARGEIREAVHRARGGHPPQVWLETEHRPIAVRSASGVTEPIEVLSGQRVAAFCGIGNPSAFRRTLAEIGVDLVGFRSFADHHPYSRQDVDTLARWAASTGADRLLTTLKDLVRMRLEPLGSVPLAAIEVALEPLGSADEFERLLDQAVFAEGVSQ